jgi:hypothetical protein
MEMALPEDRCRAFDLGGAEGVIHQDIGDTSVKT